MSCPLCLIKTDGILIQKTQTFEKMRIPDLNNNKLREKLFSPSRIIWIERTSHVNILKVK